MKVKDVPQEDPFVHPDQNVSLCGRLFALDDDGKYQEIPSMGWSPRNEALKFAWNCRGEEAGQVREKVLAGKCSPLAFHMVRALMTPALMAGCTGFSRKKINKFCKPKHFASLDSEALTRLAEALNMSVEELVSID